MNRPRLGLIILCLLLARHGARAALDDIDEFDADYEFEKLGLFEHLSPSRHVGVYAMVQRVKRQVSAIEESYV